MASLRTTVQQIIEEARNGIAYRAWFVNPLGISFRKDFPTSEEMDDFIHRAREVGTKLTGFVSL